MRRLMSTAQMTLLPASISIIDLQAAPTIRKCLQTNPRLDDRRQPVSHSIGQTVDPACPTGSWHPSSDARSMAAITRCVRTASSKSGAVRVPCCRSAAIIA